MRNVALCLLCLLHPLQVKSADTSDCKLGINLFAANISWENNYSNDKYDNLGKAYYLIPNFEKKFRYISLKLNTNLCFSQLDGPDGLTITCPDDDIDSGFKTKMYINNIVLGSGYNILRYLILSINMRYTFLKIIGDHEFGSLKYNYSEKGFLFGPSMNVKLPINKSTMYFDFYYYNGELNTDYKAASFSRTFRNNLTLNLYTAEIGIKIPIYQSISFGLSVKTEYYDRKGESYFYNPVDSKINGMILTVDYNFIN